MTKIVIFNGIGGFALPDLCAWHLILHRGWQVVDIDYHYPDNENILFENDGWFDNRFGFINWYENSIRSNPDVIEAYELWKPKDYKIVDVPEDINWYIYESDCGSESVHEKHRIWD